MTLRYLMDEQVPAALVRAIWQRAPEVVVWRIGEAGAPARATADPDLLVWCDLHGFVLVTSNRRTMPAHLADHLRAGRHVPGIFILNPEMGMGATVTHLIEAAGASLEGEHQDQIKFIPL